MTDIEDLHFMDLQTDLAFAIDHFGARAILMQFKESYPTHYNELVAQVVRHQNPQKIPVLLLKKQPE